MDTKELGALGEKLACEYLVRKGYKILGKNYRISFGEIDIIALKKWKFFVRRDKTIHFVEVKTIIGVGDSFYPEERVDRNKQRKLSQMAQIWLEKNKFPQDFPCQIDVIGIIINNGSKNAKLHYFQNVVKDS